MPKHKLAEASELLEKAADILADTEWPALADAAAELADAVEVAIPLETDAA